MDIAKRIELLTGAHDAYLAEVSMDYDEVLEDVVQRIQHHGFVSKLDISGLVCWKRLRADTPWMSRLMATTDAEVQMITRRVVHAAGDATVEVVDAAAAARSALAELDGFRTGDALASAICHAAAPDRLAVYDRRAHRGLGRVGLSLTSGSGRYARYTRLVEQCRGELADYGHPWPARMVDLALFQLGGPVSNI